MAKKNLTIVLAGQPNCGKTSIFNALTGTRQHVGNYPGVTVERKNGHFSIDEYDIELIDLPGVYSLSSNSPEEEVVVRELMKPGIDLIINVLDSSIPQRSLYLTTQLAELHIPMLLVFNMSDDAQKKGISFDIAKLETYFGSPIVQTIGNKSNGAKDLIAQLKKTLPVLEEHGVPMLTYGADTDDAIQAVSDRIMQLPQQPYSHIPARYFAIKLLEQDIYVSGLQEFKSVHDEVEAQIKHLQEKHAIDAHTFMADCRYAMLAGACRNSISITQERRREISDKIDLVLTNKFLGLPIFLLIIYITFWLTFTCAEPFVGYIESFFGFITEFIAGIWPQNQYPYLKDLVLEGIVGGVGGVMTFVPNILLLFMAIALLEGTGYMSRASFVMDGVMRLCGLQGRSFVPLILGFGCSVPAIMATRTIESERDRKVTIMILPLMSCGARLPIYTLLVSAFFAKNQALMMWFIYILGVVVALLAAKVMKSTLFKGDGEVYLMELPPYRIPTFKSLLLHMWDRGKMYLQKAGTLILGASIILFVCNTFPQKKIFDKDYEGLIQTIETKQSLTAEEWQLVSQVPQLQEALPQIRNAQCISQEIIDNLNADELQEPIQAILKRQSDCNEQITMLSNEKQEEMMEYTISGRIGHFLNPLFKHIGFDWRLTTASVGALAAKEIFVSQLGIVFAEGEIDAEDTPESFREKLVNTYSPLQALSIMIFSLLSIPCFATLAVIKRELNSWTMMFVEACGLFALAYLISLVVYQVGSFLNLGTKIVS